MFLPSGWVSSGKTISSSLNISFRRKPVDLLVGSKAEYHRFKTEIEGSGRNVKWIRQIKDISLWHPVLFIAGTGHLHKLFEDAVQVAEKRNGIIHYYDTPGLFIVPALEIAHEFAEYLGIDSRWRYESEERDLESPSTSG